MEKDVFSEAKLTELLNGEPFFSAACCYDCVTSTNDVAKELTKNGARQGTVVVAGSQTSGRGRMGRRFYSPGETGLYMSLILRPNMNQQDAGLLTACGAVSVHQAILELTGVSVEIKWVNDLYYQGKKLCGILAEGQCNASGSFEYVILGIGVNVAPPENGYADEIKGKTTSLSEICGKMPDRLELCAAIMQHWFSFYEKLPQVEFLQIYRSCSCVLGKSVSYIKEGKTFTGKAFSIDESARLLVQRENGVVEALETGEVSMVRQAL